MSKGIMHFDGGSRGNPGPSAGAAVLQIEGKLDKPEIAAFLERATVNEAEYRGLIEGLKLAIAEGVTQIKIYGDSQLVVKHVTGEYTCRAEHLYPLLTEVRQLLKQLSAWEIHWIRRNENGHADRLCNQCLDQNCEKKKTLPCSNCPFRKDRPFRGLSRKRAEEIYAELMADSRFNCHKTVDYSTNPNGNASKATLCVGSVIFLNQVRPNGAMANLGVRLQVLSQKFDLNDVSDKVPVYSSKTSFLNGASSRWYRK